MIIYSSKLVLKNPLQEVLAPVENWLAYHSNRSGVDLGQITDEFSNLAGKRHEWKLAKSAWISLDSELDEDRARVHIEYRHPDSRINGRRWTTEIGLAAEGPEGTILTSLLAVDDDLASLTDRPPTWTRPLFIKNVLDGCMISTRTVGSSIKEIDEDTAAGYDYVVTDPARDYPFVVVSPTRSGDYRVDIEWLQSYVVGLADVVKIDRYANTFELVRSLGSIGRHVAVWNGAIAVVYPPLARQEPKSRPYIPVERFLSEDLDRLRIPEGKDARQYIANHILGELTAKVGRRFAKKHLSVRELHDFRVKKLLKNLHGQRAASTSAEHLQEEIEAAEQLLGEQQDELEVLRQENNELRSANEEFQLRLYSFDYRRDQEEQGKLTSSIRDAIVSLVDEQSTPEQTLIVLQYLFPERIVVLDSALSAAQQSAVFRQRSKLAGLLWKLATAYWHGRKENAPEPHRAFPRDLFASKDSFKGGKQPKRAEQLRTFSYKGRPIHMPMHLKVGRGEGAGEGIRVHFEWDDETDRVIIGYCGKHLDTR